MFYWFFLSVAIITEVIGTVSMRYSAHGFPLTGLFIMYLMLILSYSSLAIAVIKIPIAVAYGAWESVGLVLIAILSAILFSESLSFIKIIAISMIILGIILLDYGTETFHTKRK